MSTAAYTSYHNGAVQQQHPSISSSSSSSTTPIAGQTTAQADALAHDDDAAGKKKKAAKRRKVNHACLYCRRSHMTCDEGRPCQRCIKREIGHLCHDERRPKSVEKPAGMQSAGTVDLARTFAPPQMFQPPPQNSAWPPVSMQPNGFLYPQETLGNEFSVLSDFLETLDEGSFFTSQPSVPTSLLSSSYAGSGGPQNSSNFDSESAVESEQQSDLRISSTANVTGATTSTSSTSTSTSAAVVNPETSSAAGASSSNAGSDVPTIILPAATKTEKFLLTAADQESGSRDERLNRVIQSKYEAGLLKPYNYVKGYARLSRWMDRNVSQESKQQILQPLSVLRPKFRAVAQSLQDIDLVFIEEAFERLLLDYDRVFSAMGVPACLWRRTGEIYKGNREFTELVGVDGYMMRDGRLCIYELMAEESAVNYWEKYGHVAFDSSQKAVLTSCVLRYKPKLANQHHHSHSSSLGSVGGGVGGTPGPSKAVVGRSGGSSGGGGGDGEEGEGVTSEEGFINCCFSFTIRRDKWGIPTMIVGNFIKC